MENSTISIFDYLDYRTFLRNYIESRRRVNSGISFRSIALRMGCNAGFFNRVLNRQRNLSPEFVLKLTDIIGLNKREGLYFELLVSFNQAKKQREKDHYFEQLEVFRKMHIKQVSDRQYALYSHWFYVVLRELLNFIPWTNNDEVTRKLLGKMCLPPVPVQKIGEALQVLEEQKLIFPDKKGGRILDEQFITSGTDIPPVVINRIIIEFIKLAREAIDRFPRSERSMSTLTFSTSRSAYEKIQRKLDDYRKEIMAIVNEDPTDPQRVYHLNLHLFPVSQPYKGASE